MKFTRKNATNQRIERITMKHAVVGIDIAKDLHAAQITDYRGRVLTPRHLSFSNSLEGFEKLLRWVKEAQSKHQLSSLIIALEPTGHYWFNLANWLVEQGIEVVMVNPVLTHRNKENRDNSPSKNDPKDALTIADLASRGYYTDYALQEESFERMKTLMSDREYWAKQAISFGNRIVRWIDIYFPEFRRVFPDWTTIRSIASLQAFPLPSDLENLSAEDIVAGWREQGMKRAGGASGTAKAAALLTATKRSVGKSQATEEAKKDLKRLLDAYKQANKTLDEMQVDIEAQLDIMPGTKPLRSIEGLGTIPIVAILGCAGDLRHYAHGRQLLRRAGLNLAECTSGKFKGQIKLSKRGDGTLRKYLYLGMINLVGHHPDFKRWHEQNQQRGMKKMDSIFKLIGKLSRMIVAMVHNGELYRSECNSYTAA